MKDLSSSFNGFVPHLADNSTSRTFFNLPIGDRRNMQFMTRMIIVAWFGIAVLSPCCGCNRDLESDVSEPQINRELRRVGFTAAQVDTLPEGWEIARTGDGDGSRWVVVVDETAPSGSGLVIAQTAASPRSMFNLCVMECARYADLKLSVAIKAVEGEIDQGGGLVWRYLDANNYYVCRFNPLEDNLRVYKVIAGKRHQLASVDVERPSRQWCTLTATMKDDLIVCSVDGTRLGVRDGTLREPGRIGLWTKADARTYFDTVSVTGSDVTRVEKRQAQ